MLQLQNDQPVSILVVDDDDVDRERIARLLRKGSLKHKITEAASVIEALSLFCNQRFDCIILDNRLGNYSGFDFMNELKDAQIAFLPIIMVTGLGDESIAGAAIRHGVSDYMTKQEISEQSLAQSVVSAIQRSQLERQLHELAHYDALTGLATRTLLIDRLQQAILQTARDPRLSALVFIDLDHFKPINDNFGHAAGDEVLVEVAQRLRKATRPTDTVARLGGDEFVVLLTLLDNAEQCQKTLRRMQDLICKPILLKEGSEVSVSASIGAAIIQEPSLNADTVLRRADQTMYQVKSSGRNDVRFFDLEGEKQMKAIGKIRDEALAGLAEKQFMLFYQPKVDLRTRRLIGFESLLRWQHPEKGFMLPSDFQSILDNDALAAPIGEWVFRQALDQLDRWSRAGIACKKVSVNISPKHLQRHDFIPRLRHAFEAVPGVSPSLIELEILESAALQDLAKVRSVIDECHDLGVSVALDDFGTGYSSLTHFRNLQIDTLKIDKSFVINMLGNADDRAIVSTVVNLCETFGRNVIAEGVETDAHMRHLVDVGCTLGQGFGIAHPLPANEAATWLAAA